MAEVAHSFRPDEWIVDQSYAIRTQVGKSSPQARVIVPEGPVTYYVPSQHPELPSTLAQVREGDEAAALEFVHTYGLLGYHLARASSGDHLGQSHGPGDPLDWLWAHAATVRFCFDIMTLLQQKNWAALEQYRQTHIKVAERGRIRHPLCFTAELLMMDVINRNIGGIHPQVEYRRGYYTYSYVFTALVEMVYWHLAEGMRARHPVQQCANPRCGRPFIRQNGKQRYCPPIKGQPASSCSNSHRQAKWRQTHADQDE